MKNGGLCFDKNGEDPFECQCAGSYVGRTCDEDICTGIKCINGGNCVVDDTDSNNIQPKCNCPDGFLGDACQLTVCGTLGDEIHCLNGSKCNAGICDCPKDEHGNDLFYGRTCNLPPICQGDPCQNGGECNTLYDSNSSEDCIAIQI